MINKFVIKWVFKTTLLSYLVSFLLKEEVNQKWRNSQWAGSSWTQLLNVMYRGSEKPREELSLLKCQAYTFDPSELFPDLSLTFRISFVHRHFYTWDKPMLERNILYRSLSFLHLCIIRSSLGLVTRLTVERLSMWCCTSADLGSEAGEYNVAFTAEKDVQKKVALKYWTL